MNSVNRTLRHTHQTVIVIVLVAALNACGERNKEAGADAGYLQDPAFATLSEPNDSSPAWRIEQHGGPRSYRTSVTDGVLSIERIGEEPWGQATQTLPAKELRGKTITFSADLAGTLKAVPGPDSHLTRMTGVFIVLKGYPDPGMRMLGKSILTRAQSPVMAPGEHDWQRHKVSLVVPETATDIIVGIRLSLGGALKARAPRLVAASGSQ